jgi:putative hydrolase of the HAD superfamily
VVGVTIRWVIFDLGDVVLRRTTALPRLAALVGMPPEAFGTAYFGARAAYDLHSDPGRFFSEVAGRSLPGTAVTELVAADDDGWNVPDPATLALIHDLAALDLQLGVLSNAPSSMGRLAESSDWAAPFRVLVFSGDHGLVKPDREIFDLLLHRLGDPPAEAVVFLDDKAENVAGARAAGLAGVLFVDAAQARVALRDLGLGV